MNLGRASSLSADPAVYSDLSQISETFQQLQQEVTELLDHESNALPKLKQVLASLVLPLGKGKIGPLVDPDICESAHSVQELFKLMAPYWNPLSTDLLGLLLETSGYKQVAEKVAKFVKDRANKSNLILQLPDGADLETVHNTPLSELQSLHPDFFATLPELEVTSTRSRVRISVELKEPQLSISNYEKITTALCGFFEIPKAAVVYAGCSKAPLVLCWLVPSVLIAYIKSFPLGLGLSGHRMLVECNVAGVAVGADWIYKCPTIEVRESGISSIHKRIRACASVHAVVWTHNFRYFLVHNTFSNPFYFISLSPFSGSGARRGMSI